MDTTTQLPVSLSPTPTTYRGFRGWVARHPVTAFLVIMFSIAYPMMMWPILAERGLLPGGSLHTFFRIDTEEFASMLGLLFGLLPAALLVTWAADGRDGLRRLRARMFRWRIGLRWWLTVLLALPVLTVGTALLLGDSLVPIDAGTAVHQVVRLAIGFGLINLWEETAWSGLVQTRLERRFGLFLAAMITAVPFALFHLPLHLIGDVTLGSVVSGMIVMLIACLAFRLMFAVTLRGVGDSLMAVGLLHTMLNRSNNSDGIAAVLLHGEARPLAALIAMLLLTLVLGVVLRHRLGRSYRAELDARTEARIQAAQIGVSAA